MVSVPRPLLITALIGLLVASIGAWLAGGAATRTSATHGLANRSIDELALLAGLADDDGKLLRDERMPVEVISDGGPLWVLPVIEHATKQSAWFSVGSSPHLLRVEVIDEPGAVAMQLHLWRGGWELREPNPRRIRIAVWAAVVAGLLGAVIAVLLRKLSVGLFAAGVFAQLALAFAPLPPELFPPQSLGEAWAEGPLFGPLFESIRAMTPMAVAGAAAIVTASLVLVGFDHKRSRERNDDVGLGWAGITAVLGTFGAIAWIEAASRGSLFAACDLRFGAWAGWLALLGLIAAWLPAIHVFREAWRSQRVPMGQPVAQPDASAEG
jgi:hypothetical protein